MIEYLYVTWVVEGSNGQRMYGPSSFEDAQKFIAKHEDYIHSAYSASHPMPDSMVRGWEKANLGYLLRRVNMRAVEENAR